MAHYDDTFVDYVAAHRPRLYRAAYLLCGDAHRAEDIVQNALSKLYVGWARASRANSVDAYVRRALVNSHIDETRRPWRRERPTSDWPEAAVADPQVAESDALWRAIRGLPAGQRRVVVLRHYWGLGVAETAADLGISEGTVKSQTAVALKALRAVLETEESGDRT